MFSFMGNRFTRADLLGCEKKTANFVFPVFTKLHGSPLGHGYMHTGKVS